MMRLFLALATVMAAMSFEIHPVRAGEAPWCAVVSNGLGSVYWDCQYRTVEECVPNVIAGNRGSCNHNPAYVGEPRPAQKHKARRKRGVRKD